MLIGGLSPATAAAGGTIVLTSPPAGAVYFLSEQGFVDIPVAGETDCVPQTSVKFTVDGGSTSEYPCPDGVWKVHFSFTVRATSAGVPLVSVCDQTPDFVGWGCLPRGFLGIDVRIIPFELVDPTVAITSPADGASFLVGEAVTAHYGCFDEAGGSGLASCFGPVPDGGSLDTGEPGQKSFTVVATDWAGNVTTRTHSYTVEEPDRDEDGVPDATDKCPDLSDKDMPRTPRDGCPLLKAVATTERSHDDPLKVTFDGSKSEGDIVEWRWDFGDGTTGKGETVDHVYPDGAARTATLTVVDAHGTEVETEVGLEKCASKLALGPVAMKGCVYEFPDRWVALGEVSLNGLEVTPVGEARVVMDLKPLRLTAIGAVRIKFGELTLFEGQVSWHLAGGPILLTIPQGQTYKNFDMAGGAALTFNAAAGVASVELAAGVELKRVDPTPLALPDQKPTISGEFKAVATLDGVRLDSMTVEGKYLAIGLPLTRLEVKDFKLVYKQVPQGDLFTGTASIGPPLGPAYQGEVTLLNGEFAGAGIEFKDLNIPVPSPPAPPGIYFQRAGLRFVMAPALEMEGVAGVSLGPSIRGVSAVRVDGSIKYQSEGACKGRGTKGATMTVSGELRFMDSEDSKGPFGTGYVCWQPGGNLLSAGGTLAAELWGWSFEGSVDGFVDGRHAATLTGLATLRSPFDDVPGLPKPPPSHRARAILSEIGLGACYEGDAPGLGQPGTNGESGNWMRFGMMWKFGEFPRWGCDLEAFRTVNASLSRLHSAARPAATTSLPSGLPGAAFAVTGDGGPPKLRITGPGGVVIEANDVSRATKGAGWLAFPDPVNGITYVIVTAPTGGRWSVESLGGNPRIAKVEVARGLPEPQVFGTVTGEGEERVLTWTARKIAGQRIRFFEEGDDVARLIGESDAASGTLRFVPAAAGSAGRRITAVIDQDGLPRARMEVAAFVPGPDSGLADGVAPGMSGMSVRPGTIRPPKRGGESVLRGAAATVRYKLSEPATVRFGVERGSTGVRRGKKCVAAPRRRKRQTKPCVRWRTAKGSFSQAGAEGDNRFGFTGRLAGKPLQAGSYRLVATPIDLSGNPGGSVRAKFSVRR